MHVLTHIHVPLENWLLKPLPTHRSPQLVPRVLEILWTARETVLSSHPEGFKLQAAGLGYNSSASSSGLKQTNSQTPLSCPKRWNGCRDWEGQRVSLAPAASRGPARATGRPRSPRPLVPSFMPSHVCWVFPGHLGGSSVEIPPHFRSRSFHPCC